MIARKYKLPTSDFFQKASKSFSSEALRIKIRSNERGHNRFAVVIGGKVEKKSVRRHFWKRLIYDVAGAWPNRSSDVVITVSPRIQTTTPEQVRRQLSELARGFSQH